VLTLINGQLSGGATVGLNDGVLHFTPPPGAVGFVTNITDLSGALGLTNINLDHKSGISRLPIDLSAATDAERTLTFRFADPAYKEVTITLDAIAYSSSGELINHINTLLAAQGAPFTASMADDRLAFKPTSALDGFSIEGDYNGYLGFKHSGDKTALKVSDTNGRNIQYLTIDSANEEYHVSDGLLLGFNAGSLYATDSFTGNVGSGVQYELGVLDLVQNQLNQSLTQVGNRALQVETVINYQTSVINTYETQKAQHIQSTEYDQVKLLTEHELATTAYEYALSLITKSMSISILDYL
jgi:hypothetical protein